MIATLSFLMITAMFVPFALKNASTAYTFVKGLFAAK